MSGIDNTVVAPVYRYFTADLLTNKILAEIPFSGVSYGRGLSAAGEFQGSIPVIAGTSFLNSYQNTMPGNTALFVVRNGVCVWGGIIWSRTYSVVAAVLQVSALEFTSYLHHRAIWKSWTHEYGATVTVASGVASIVLDYGSTTALVPGATVNMDFIDDGLVTYSGDYIVASNPPPTNINFSLASVSLTAGIINGSLTSNVVTIQTSTPTGYNVGDIITISGTGTVYDGVHTITDISGTNLDYFSFAYTAANIPLATLVGTVSKTLPNGVYTGVTITVRLDTYHYVRELLEAVFQDFTGIEFADSTLAPGLSYDFDLTNEAIASGYGTFSTFEDHGLAIGQSVQLQNVSPTIDGTYAVSSIPGPAVFVIPLGGSLASTALSTRTATVTSISEANGEALITTSAAHGFQVGQEVQMATGIGLGDSAAYFTGTYVIDTVPSPTTFTYPVTATTTVPTVPQAPSTASVGATSQVVTRHQITSNVATLSVATTPTFSVGNSLVVAGLTPTIPITTKSYNATTGVATITTTNPHYLAVGDTVTLSGLRDSATITQYSLTGTSNPRTYSMTTATPHNFLVGDVVTLSSLTDSYAVTNKALTSNVATLTTSVPHNMIVGDVATVVGITDTSTISTIALTSGVATVTFTGTHNFQVNQVVTIANIQNTGVITDKETYGGNAYLTLSTNHNFLVGDTVTVAGLGAPYDGSQTVTVVTATRVVFSTGDDVAVRPPTKAVGATITGTTSIFNGPWTVSSTTSNSISYALVGNDLAVVTPTGATTPVATGDSILQGSYTLTAVTSTTISYALVANNITSVAVPQVTAAASTDTDGVITPNVVPAAVSVPSRAQGTQTITAVTPFSFNFTQSTGLSTAVALSPASGLASVNSIFNTTTTYPTWTVTSVTPYTFNYTLPGTRVSNVLETVNDNVAFAQAPNLFNGTFTITAVDTVNNTVSYTRTHSDIPFTVSPGASSASVTPTAIVSSYGPYPGNADIGIEFDTRGYSGVDITPTDFRGFELTIVGDALDSYASSSTGFDYRIDCFYDDSTSLFRKVFVLIPIQVPDAPTDGSVSPLTRFGADKIVFQYPGNIIDVEWDESADSAATRFFAVGSSSDGSSTDAAPVSAAVSDGQLDGTNGEDEIRAWPLLDEVESVSDVDDLTVLYAYATQYLNEAQAPVITLSVDVNGSMEPVVGSYAPGDWCSLLVDDPYIQARLAANLEPRTDVIVRKIDSYSVAVPDGSTYPDVVTLTLVPDWQVDTSG